MVPGSLGVKMGVLGNPFKLFGRLLIASFQITGYTVIFITQIIWFISYRRTDIIGDAFGSFGRSVTDAVATIFKD